MICKHCGETIKNPSGHAAHVKACVKHPGDAELRRMHDSGLTQIAIAEHCGVSDYIIRKWFNAAGIKVGRRKAADLVIEPSLAPMFRKGKSRRRMECSVCTVAEACRRTVMEIGWMPCEAPDEEQLAFLERNGVDLATVVKEI